MPDYREYCEDCKYVRYDCYDYYGGGVEWFIDGCKKDLEPYYDKEEECVTCEGYKIQEMDY